MLGPRQNVSAAPAPTPPAWLGPNPRSACGAGGYAVGTGKGALRSEKPLGTKKKCKHKLFEKRGKSRNMEKWKYIYILDNRCFSRPNISLPYIKVALIGGISSTNFESYF